jgi:PAS domain S-box-containing protein
LRAEVTRLRRQVADLETRQPLSDSIQESLLILDRPGTILDINTFGAARFNTTRQELVGRNLYEMLPAELAKSRRAHIISAFDTGQVVKFEDHRAGVDFLVRVYPVFPPPELSPEGGEPAKPQKCDHVLIFAIDITARVAARAALQASEARFRAVFDNAPIGISLTDFQGRAVLSNPAVWKSLGYEAEALARMSFTEYTHPDDIEADMSRFQEILAGNRDSYQLVKRYLHRDGHTSWIDMHVAAIRDQDGQLQNILSMGADITAIKEAEAALQASEESLRTTLKAIPVPTYTWQYQTGDFVLVDYNDAAVEATDGKVREIIDILSTDLFRDYPEVQADLQRCYTEQVAVEREMDYRFRTTGQHWHLLVKYGYVPPDRVLLHTIDLTARRRAEAALLESERRYRTIFQNVSDGMVLIDPKGIILEANPAFCRIFGYEPHELVGFSVGRLRAPTHKEELFKLLESVKRYGSAYREVNARTKDGGWLLLGVTASVITMYAEVYVLLGIVRDITEQKRLAAERQEMEAQLRRSQRMEALGTLAGGIAHDFNNLLSPIMGFAELTAMHEPPDSRLRNNMDQIIAGATRAKSLVQQILAFSRQSETERIPTLQPLLKEVVKLLRPSLPSTIELDIRVESGVGQVMADPAQLHQILVNLSTNAFHAMEETGGTLTLTLDQIKVSAARAARHPDLHALKYARLRVCDTGTGMDSATQEHIFEPFFSTKAPDKGSGLGLAVVHGIVKSHHGAVLVDSAPGQGATFDVYLPIIESPPPGTSSVIGASPILYRGTERILLVDDESAMVKLLSDVLTHLGYKITAFGSPTEALAQFQQTPDEFDLVITDLTMPRLTGLGLAARLKQERPHLPIILITGFGVETDAAVAANSGISVVIHKPIVFSDLTTAIRRALAGRQ